MLTSVQGSFGSALEVSVIICAHRPNRERLERTLAGLAGQTLPCNQWECLVVNNGPEGGVCPETLAGSGLHNLRLVQEPTLGLGYARRRGVLDAQASILVFVDDDNVLAPDYLATALTLLAEHPEIGALGGISKPEFAITPPEWVKEFHGLLALRDLGAKPQISPRGHPPLLEFPAQAPIGAGMVTRRQSLSKWLQDSDLDRIPDRQGSRLCSGGDNDMVAYVLESGWSVAYFPQLVLTHLIPAQRLTMEYLARLNEGIQESWVQVLDLHGIRPWPSCSRLGASLRILRAWMRHRPWLSAARWVRFRGDCGHFRGRAKLPRKTNSAATHQP